MINSLIRETVSVNERLCLLHERVLDTVDVSDYSDHIIDNINSLSYVSIESIFGRITLNLLADGMQ